jgi:hypothetical protein
MTRVRIISKAIATAIVLAGGGHAASACCKGTFIRTKPHVNVSSSGHSDGRHGVPSRLSGSAKSAKRETELVVIITPVLTGPSK